MNIFRCKSVHYGRLQSEMKCSLSMHTVSVRIYLLCSLNTSTTQFLNILPPNFPPHIMSNAYIYSANFSGLTSPLLSLSNHVFTHVAVKIEHVFDTHVKRIMITERHFAVFSSCMYMAYDDFNGERQSGCVL